MCGFTQTIGRIERPSLSSQYVENFESLPLQSRPKSALLSSPELGMCCGTIVMQKEANFCAGVDCIVAYVAKVSVRKMRCPYTPGARSKWL